MRTETVVLVCVALGIVNAKVDTPCTEDSQCDEGECCQILSEFFVVSKRAETSGTCQRFALENEPCALFDKVNGFCSCSPGTFCKAVEVLIDPSATVATVQKRKPVPPRPGYAYDIKCVREEQAGSDQ